jgi:tryptophan halogenase
MNGGERRVRRIAILGKSHELWPVAALLGKNLTADMELIAVEEPEAYGPAAITIRLDDPFLVRLGIGAEALLRVDSAILALGTELRGWRGDHSRFFLTGSGDLPEVEDIAIHQIMLRAALTYDQPERLAYLYQPFRLPARIAEAGKFAFQSSDPRSPLSIMRPTVHLDRSHYAALLKNSFSTDRMDIVEARPKAVRVSADSGTIVRVELDNGRAIDADLYIDVSGAVSGLTKLASSSDWHSISDGLPFDRLLAAEKAGEPPKWDRHEVAQAIKGGLLITTPLRKTSIAQLVCASSAMTSEEQQDLAGYGGNAMVFEPGYLRQPWTGNLVRLGSASSCFGPFLSADTTMLHRQAAIFTDHMPVRLEMTVEAREYNRRHLIAAQQIRDFVQLPFALSHRGDKAWIGVRDSKLSESLTIRLDQFRSRGRFVAFESEIFDQQSWIDLMIGFGIVPERYDPMAQSLDMTTMARRLKKLSSAFGQALATIPAYEEAIGAAGAIGLD